MISVSDKETILALYKAGNGLRQISRLLSISRNTVRRVSNWKTGYMQQNCHCIEALTSQNLSAKKEGLALCPFFIIGH